MKNMTVFATFFTISILLFGTVISPLNLIGSADALKSRGNPALEIGSKKVCGDKLCSEISKEPPKQEKKKEQVKTEKKESEKKKLDDKKTTQQERYDLTALPPRTIKTGTMTSVQDPGIGHEKHQLAIILPPRTGAYFGTLGYSASDEVQLIALHGPLRSGQDNGQAIWSPDGETKFALTFIDRESSMGTWQFSANAIALHSMDTEPFTVSYSVVTGQ